MAANMFDINHLDADVLLPPRKRLLAGLKKQTSEANGADVTPTVACPMTSSSSTSNEYDSHLSNLLASHLNNPNVTPEQIAEKSRSDAIAAAKAAKAARAAAEEKAAIAVQAVAAAKSALDLVASFSEDGASKERNLKKNRQKKHVPVQLLYTKQQSTENGRTDEDLAHKLHRAINSSPRISKTSSSSERKGYKHKKPKSSPATSEKTKQLNGGMALGENLHPVSNRHHIAGEVDSDDSNDGIDTIKADKKSFRYQVGGQLELEDAQGESSRLKEKLREDTTLSGKKRGRGKLKTYSKHL